MLINKLKKQTNRCGVGGNGYCNLRKKKKPFVFVNLWIKRYYFKSFISYSNDKVILKLADKLFFKTVKLTAKKGIKNMPYKLHKISNHHIVNTRLSLDNETLLQQQELQLVVTTPIEIQESFFIPFDEEGIWKISNSLTLPIDSKIEMCDGQEFELRRAAAGFFEDLEVGDDLSSINISAILLDKYIANYNKLLKALKMEDQLLILKGKLVITNHEAKFHHCAHKIPLKTIISPFKTVYEIGGSDLLPMSAEEGVNKLTVLRGMYIDECSEKGIMLNDEYLIRVEESIRELSIKIHAEAYLKLLK